MDKQASERFSSSPPRRSLTPRPPRLWLASYPGPLGVLRRGVNGKCLFVLDQHGPHHARIVSAAKVQNRIGNDPHLLVRIDECEHRLGIGNIGQLLVGAFKELPYIAYS